MTSADRSGTPANGTRPPFPKGNAMTVKSGARSPRVYGRLARQLAAGLVEDRKDLGDYPEAVAAWATAEAQVALLRRHLEQVGTIDPETMEPRAASLHWLKHFEKLAAEARATLGLDPRSEAALAKERAAAQTLMVDLHAIAERGAAAIAAREAAGIVELDTPGDVLREVLDAAPPAIESRLEPQS
ncbi:hypothetical protein [Microbacterium sp.]|uniref:hypothetical protein n=1 Tax=Microbacterium sp. TaxID=51671 RepID=UPI003C74D4E1